MIVIAALTYLRPKGLAALLDGLAQLDCRGLGDVRVLIVDNAPGGPAEALVTERARVFPLPLTYLQEPVRGLTPARNRALTEALALGAERLAFIDDDEVPEPSWLRAHIATLTQTGADASVGAVHAAWTVVPPGWLRRGRFLEIRGAGPGRPLSEGNTSNVLFRLDPVLAEGLAFHPAFSLTGGEDTQFFREYQAAGSRIVFAPDAVVHETIGPERTRLGWLLRRWRRTGQTNGKIRMLRQNGPVARSVCVAGGLLRVVVGGGLALFLAPFWVMGRGEVVARPLRIAMRGVGFVDASLGHRWEEYRRPHR